MLELTEALGVKIQLKLLAFVVTSENVTTSFTSALINEDTKSAAQAMLFSEVLFCAKTHLENKKTKNKMVELNFIKQKVCYFIKLKIKAHKFSTKN